MARAELSVAWHTDAASWPWATFVANVAGAFLLGYFATRLAERLPPSALRRPLLGTGFCGGLTTFSTLELELVRMVHRGDLGLGVAYAAASVGAGMAAVALASNLVRRGGLQH